jgi:hypothetical protein
MNMLSELWSWKIQILPILLTVLLFESPAIIRRWKKLFYVPIYFSVFPLKELNQDLATYLIEDDMIGLGERLTPDQVEKLRKKIIVLSVVSMTIGALFAPLLTGFISAFYMTKEIFIQFMVIFILYKAIFLVKSIVQFHHHAIGTVRNRVILSAIYVSYLGVIFEIMRSTFNWTAPYVQSGSWSNLFSDLSTLIFGKAILGILILGLLTAVFVSWITDRELRERVISRDK